MSSLRTFASALLASFFLGVALPAAAQLAEKKALTLEAAKKIAAAAEAEAVKNKWNVVIAIVDAQPRCSRMQSRVAATH
jgi:hypothetical protein